MMSGLFELTWQVDSLNEEVHTHGLLVVLGELVLGEAVSDRGFPYRTISQQNDFILTHDDIIFVSFVFYDRL